MMTTRSVDSTADHDARLRDLRDERDGERRLRAWSAAISLWGLVAGVIGRRRWLLVPLVVQGLVLHRSLQGATPAARSAPARRKGGRLRR